MTEENDTDSLRQVGSLTSVSTLQVPLLTVEDSTTGEDAISRKSLPFEHQEGLFPGQIYNEVDRPHWEPYNCILSMVGFAIGLSNIYRFPYLCFKYGGANFLIPYTFFLIFCGVPLLYLEVIVGQFCQSGTIRTWTKLVPILRGVGWCQCILPLLLFLYNNAFLTWALHFCVTALTHTKLPWIGCHHDWNTLDCRDIPPDFEQVNITGDQLRAGAEYFRGRVQRRWKSKFADPGENKTRHNDGKNRFGLGIGDTEGLGTPDYDMVLYLIAVCVIVYIFIHRGLRFRGKGLWFTVTAPYMAMVILIYRGMAIPGAWGGIKHLYTFSKEMDDLGYFKTWVAAAEQMFFSLGTGAGIHMTLSSYNDFKNNVYKDAIATVLVDTGTSLLCGTVIFIALGSIADSDGSKMSDLFAQGPDLLFEVCCDFWGRVPGADFFAFIFFVMVFFIGLECTIEGATCGKEALFEAFGDWFDRNGKIGWVFVNTMMVVAFLGGLLCLTRGGLHVFMVLDAYTSGLPLLFCSLFMVIAFPWLWGLHELCDAAEAMTGKRPNFYLQISWKFFCPIVIFVTVILHLSTDMPASYQDKNKTIYFRSEVQTFGKIYAFVPGLFIPIGIVVHLFTREEGMPWKTRLLLGISPNYSHKDIHETGTGCRAKLSHYLYCVDCPAIVKRFTKVKVTPMPQLTAEEKDEFKISNDGPSPPEDGPSPLAP